MTEPRTAVMPVKQLTKARKMQIEFGYIRGYIAQKNAG
jgi:hypothetical protein